MTLTEIAIILAQRLNMQFDEPFVLMTKDLIKLWDATITLQRLDSKPTDRVYFTQSIVLPMKKVDKTECNVLDIEGDIITRTVDTIPNLIRTNILFDYVGAENFSNPYTMVTPLKLAYEDFQRGKKKKSKFILRNGYIYVYNSIADNLGVTSIFANPEQISFCNCRKTDKNCNELEVEYKRPDDIIQKIIQSISVTDFRLQAKDANNEQIKPINE